MFDSILIALITVFAGIVVYYHIKKQITKGIAAGNCTKCPLHRKDTP